MSWSPFLRNNNNYNYNAGYDPNAYTRRRKRAAIAIILAIFVALGGIALVLYIVLPKNNQQSDENTQKVTAAAQKTIPNATVSKVKVSGGYAVALVGNPSTSGSQADAGNKTLFKVNSDGSMTQIAVGSSFSALDLLELGIPFSTQAALMGGTADEAQQNFLNTCSYVGDSNPGFSGFNSSFEPDGWQIDATTLDGLLSALNTKISSDNERSTSTSDTMVVCVNAVRKNSNVTTNTQTYVSTFTIEVHLITLKGSLSVHTLTFETGPGNYRRYALDGQAL